MAEPGPQPLGAQAQAQTLAELLAARLRTAGLLAGCAVADAASSGDASTSRSRRDSSHFAGHRQNSDATMSGADASSIGGAMTGCATSVMMSASTGALRPWAHQQQRQ